jgi:antitoxin HigA-1
MRPLGLTGNALALALRVPHSRISGVISGSRGVTADTALRLARYFDTSPEFWLYMQAGHDLSKAQVESGKQIAAEVRRTAEPAAQGTPHPPSTLKAVAFIPKRDTRE